MEPSLDGLTLPSPGATTLRAVTNRQRRLLVSDYLALPSSREREAVGAIAAARRLLATDPRPLVRALRRPTIASLVGAVRRLPRSEAATSRALLAELDRLLLAELAFDRALPEPLLVPGGERFVLRSLGARCAATVPAGRPLAFAAGSVRLAAPDEPPPFEPAYVEIVDGILFATSDNNPLLPVQGHPEREGNAVDLGGRSVDEWCASLREAFAIVREHLPSIYEEMRLALELVVPVGYDPERHFSVSYRDAVGAVYLTLHPNVLTLAEALIHEFQHNKLNAVFRFDDVLESGRVPAFASPVRPDLRPLTGVLMAAHAFLPVAAAYESMRASGHLLSLGRDFDARFRQIVESNHEATTTVLAHASPTPLGRGLLEELHRLDERFVAYARERLTPR